MKDFDYNLLCHYIDDGYQYVLYYSMEHFGILVPCLEEPQTDENSYVLPITDEQVYAMAEDDDFSIYVFQ
jgi:hypothetical protein